MANREALRELHNRLASRLQAARTDDVAAGWLAVEAGGGKYLLPLAQAGEIYAWTPALPVPYAQPWFLGVANLRGGLYAVVELASFLDPGRAPVQLGSEQARAEARLVSFNPALDINCVLQVSRLAGLRNSKAFISQEAPAEGAPEHIGGIYTDSMGGRWEVLDMLALSRQSQFLNISA